jgi:hypothetical protein
MRPVFALFLACFLMACGSSKPAWMKHQAKLLDDDEAVSAGKDTKAAASKAAAATDLGMADTTPPHCVGFRKDGAGALVVIGDDDGGARFLRAAAGGTGVTEVVMVQLEAADSEEAVFGDAQQASIEEALPKINAQVKDGEMQACATAEAPSGGGFRRTEAVLVAYPRGGAARVSLRDGAVWVTPDGKGARSIRKISTGDDHVWRIDAVYYHEKLTNIAVVLVDEYGAAVKSELLWITEDLLK